MTHGLRIVNNGQRYQGNLLGDPNPIVRDVLTDWYFGVSTPSQYFGILKRWTGSTWAKAKLMTYNGMWQAKKLKRWNGTEWKEVDTTGT
jgi:hypothetical protein